MDSFRIVLLCALLVTLASPLAAQAQLFTVTVDDGITPIVGGGTWTFTDVGDGVTAKLDGTSTLAGFAPSKLAWVQQLILTTGHWQWISPGQAPFGQSIDEFSAGYVLNFGNQGFVTAELTVDLTTDEATLELFTDQWFPNSQTDPQGPFWAEIVESFDWGGQGQQSTGCLIVNGRQVATLFASYSTIPFVDLGSVGPTQVRATTYMDADLQQMTAEGEVTVGGQQKVGIVVEADLGNGYQLVANGSAGLGPDTIGDQFSIFADLDLFDSNIENVLYLMDATWMPVWARVAHPPSAWSTLPSTLLGQQQIDVGGSPLLVDLDFDFGAQSLEVKIDLTQFNLQMPAPVNPHRLRASEAFDGIGNGKLSSGGTLFLDGVEIASYSGLYDLGSLVDTSNVPTVVTDAVIDQGWSGQQPIKLTAAAQGRHEVESSVTLGATWIIDGQLTTATGWLDIFPLGSPENEDPLGSVVSVSGQLQLSQPLPNRHLFLGQLPGITALLVQSSALSQYPPPEGENGSGDAGVDWGEAGWASALYGFTGVGSFLNLILDTDDSDLQELLPLPPKFWIDAGGYHDQGEEDTVEEDDCVTVCDGDPDDPNTICQTTCAVKYAARGQTFPKNGGNLWLDLFGRLVLCIDFSPDDQTITFVGTYALSLPPVTGVTPVTTQLSFAGPQPNPVSSMARFEAHLPEPTVLALRIYDVQGRLVRTVHEGPSPAGPVTLSWDRRDGFGQPVASGTYFARLSAGTDGFTRKVLVLR